MIGQAIAVAIFNDLMPDHQVPDPDDDEDPGPRFMEADWSVAEGNDDDEDC